MLGRVGVGLGFFLSISAQKPVATRTRCRRLQELGLCKRWVPELSALHVESPPCLMGMGRGDAACVCARVHVRVQEAEREIQGPHCADNLAGPHLHRDPHTGPQTHCL